MRQQTPVFSQSQFDPSYGCAIRVREFERPMLSDEVETSQTIAYMEELAAFDAGEKNVIAKAHEALRDAGIGIEADCFRKACAIFWWLKRHIRYAPTPATSALVDQTLIAPSALVAMPDPEGDCAQFSMLAMAMCRICCVPCSFKTIAADPAYPRIYSHVYNVIELGPGDVMVFDSSNGPEPGAEYAIRMKERVWARTIPDQCRPKGKPQMLRSRQMNTRWRGLRGSLGGAPICDDSGNCEDSDTGEALDPFTFAPLGTAGMVDPTIAGNQLSLTASQTAPVILPSGFSISTAAPSSPSLLTTLANDFTSLATPLVKSAVQKPYYITNAQGQQVLYNPATGQVVSALSSIGTSGWLMIAAIVGVIAISRSGK